MTEEDKAKIVIGTMSKEDQKKHITKYIKDKKYQVEVEVLGKRKFAYCDDLAELDPLIKTMKAKIIEVKELNK